VQVRDRGTGIRTKDLSQIFEPYFTTRRSGTGLGLPIARSIVEGLGGTLVIKTAEGGTTIDIDLPARPPGAAAT
jgi:two-component system sensor histidine kinase HydH